MGDKNETMQLIDAVINNPDLAKDYTEDELVSCAQLLNAEYRKGSPVVSDGFYDAVIMATLSEMYPESDYLQAVEPEGEDAFGKLPQFEHTNPMLSTDKAYTEGEVERFVSRLEKEALSIGISADQILLRLTPKLDGIAGYDYGTSLVTRGDGLAGRNISHIFDRGAIVQGGTRTQGPGEIVVLEDYYQQHLRHQHSMRHPRNFIAGFCGADSVKQHHTEASQAKAVIFYPYSRLPSQTVTTEDLRENWTDYLGWSKEIGIRTDGLIVEAVDERIRSHMGATSHHHRFMLAIKSVGDEKETKVNSVTWQTGRTGRITPVAELEPVELSGAVIRRVTVHHAGLLKELGVGPGAVVRLVRSGEVIPKITGVTEPANKEDCTIPSECPSCGHEAILEKDFLVCANALHCPAQRSSSLQHFFKILGNIDLFGASTVDKLIEGGYTTLTAIYAMQTADFSALGFGPKQAQNLIDELARSRSQEVHDWQWLAAFGIRNLGRGDSKKLVKHIPLSDLVDGEVTEEQIKQIKGFGEITSKSIQAGLEEVRCEMQALMPTFTIRRSPGHNEAAEGAAEDGTLSGQYVVFTGTMTQGTRDDMKADAESKGANVQSSINGKTTLLVCGEKVGAKKIEKAQQLGVQMLSEAEYRQQYG